MIIQDERALTRYVTSDPIILAIVVSSMESFAREYRLRPPAGNPRERTYTVRGIPVLHGSVPEGNFIAKYTGGKVRMFAYSKRGLQVTDGYNTLMGRKGKLHSTE